MRVKRLINWFKDIIYKIKMRKRIKELKNKDPFIYK
jgi:hypothetical protein